MTANIQILESILGGFRASVTIDNEFGHEIIESRTLNRYATEREAYEEGELIAQNILEGL